MTFLTLDPTVAQWIAIALLVGLAVGVVVLIAISKEDAPADAGDAAAAEAAEALDVTEDEAAAEDGATVEDEVVAAEAASEIVDDLESDDTGDTDEGAEGGVTAAVEDVDDPANDSEDIADGSDNGDTEAAASEDSGEPADEEPQDTENDDVDEDSPDAVAVAEETESDSDLTENVTAESALSVAVPDDASELVAAEAAVTAAAEETVLSEYDLYAPVETNDDDTDFVSAFGSTEGETEVFALAEAVNEEDEKPSLSGATFSEEDDFGASAVVAAAAAVAAAAVLESDEDAEIETADYLIEEDIPSLSTEAVPDTDAPEDEAADEAVPDTDAPEDEAVAEAEAARATIVDGLWPWMLPDGDPRTVQNVILRDVDGVPVIVFNPDIDPATVVHAAYIGGTLPRIMVTPTSAADAATVFDAYAVKAPAAVKKRLFSENVAAALLDARATQFEGFVHDSGWLLTLSDDDAMTVSAVLAAVANAVPADLREEYALTVDGMTAADAAELLFAVPSD